jgi:HSP20 family molecular chaperone IbpA
MAEKTINDASIPARSESARTPTTREQTRFLAPAVDIYEDADGLVVVADVPGLKRNDLEIKVENGVLTIHGSMSRKRTGTPIAEEFELCDYFREFTLSDKVDHERITATYERGVLTLKLPKAEHAKPRRIEIKSK